MRTMTEDEADVQFEREERIDRDLQREPLWREAAPSREEGLERSAMSAEVNEQDAEVADDLDDEVYFAGRIALGGEG